MRRIPLLTSWKHTRSGSQGLRWRMDGEQTQPRCPLMAFNVGRTQALARGWRALRLRREFVHFISCKTARSRGERRKKDLLKKRASKTKKRPGQGMLETKCTRVRRYPWGLGLEGFAASTAFYKRRVQRGENSGGSGGVLP